MSTPRILILRAPGTNCDLETAHAFRLAGGEPDLVHVNCLLENRSLPDQYQILCVPGGFSYGDDIAAGAILASQIRLHLSESLARFREHGKLILGICNGLQVLIKSGVLLPADDGGSPMATLTWNDCGRFEDRWVHLVTSGSPAVMLQGIATLYLPVAHAEGKFVANGDASLRRLESAGHLALRYANPASREDREVPYPLNPNGSMGHVAGVCDQSGRVLGMMPHPERYIDRTQHPRWTRESLPDAGDGLKIFQNAVEYFAG